MISSGKITVKDIISECVPMERLADYLENGKPSGSLKIVLCPQK